MASRMPCHGTLTSVVRIQGRVDVPNLPTIFAEMAEVVHAQHHWGPRRIARVWRSAMGHDFPKKWKQTVASSQLSRPKECATSV